ncbi:non-ribosomal peptide synthetase [Burkholderia ubonensis]|uniref:non-ribosomal peptide synthetase n=1 Tax=Burkholderia ubonensis TaxID=101571 RepID=UPI00075C14B7|nr:non-ribosomal peptide synthetase [Burkholderia ubonensis]
MNSGPSQVPSGLDGVTFRLTYLQERIWLQEQRAPDSAVHNAPVVMLARGALDAGRLQCALDTVVARNEALRACFVELGGSVRQYPRAGVHVPLRVEDWSSLRANDGRRKLYPAISSEVSRPFDLAAGQLLRAALYKLRGEESVLVLTVHHIVSDGWSQSVLLGELAAEYAGSATFQQGKASFFAYADALRAELDASGHADARAFWSLFVAGKQCIAVPYDRLPAAARASIGRKRYFTLDARSTAAVRRMCASASVSPFAVFLAILGVLIERRVPDAGDWCLPVAVGYRDNARWLDVIGCFVDHVLVRPLADPDAAFGEYVRAVSDAWQRAFEHRSYPFDRVRLDAAEAGERLEPSLVFVYQNAATAPSIPGVDITPFALPDAPAKFDLTVMVAEQAETFSLSFEYDATRYDETTIADLGELFVALCARLTEAGDRPVSAAIRAVDAPVTPSIVVGERQQWPHMSFAEWFDAVAARHANDAALRTEAGAIRYRELRERVERIAVGLRACGGDGLRIGVHLDRSAELVMSLLAILTEGHCYVPLPPSYPDARLALLVDDSAPALVVTDARGAARLRALRPKCVVWDIEQPSEADHHAAPRGRPHAHGAAAYLIYTSGSTGEPKGAYGLANGVMNRLRWQWQALPYMSGDCVLLRSAPMFVDSVVEMLAPVLGGVCAVIASDDDVRDPVRLWRRISHERITHLTVVPSHLESLLAVREPDVDVALRTVHCSGEALSRSLSRAFDAALPGVTLVNIYGSTETTADATWQIVRGGESSIGRPIANAGVAIVDAHGDVLPRGMSGEIAVFGAPVGGGYRNAAALTAERYWPAPNGDRMFRTGDFGRIDASGVCEYLGRLDLQIKVRGMRTNVLEIEEAMRACTGLREIVVTLDASDGNRLVAYYAADDSVSRSRLADHARTVLPVHAIPGRWVRIRALPRTDSGKLRRTPVVLEALREPEGQGDTPDVQDASELERDVIAVWADVIGDGAIGLDDRFEQVGGHSLLAIQLVEALNRRFGTSLRLVEFFAEPTVRAAAARISAQTRREQPAPALLVADDAARHAPFPLLLMQQAYRLGRNLSDRAAMSTICAFSMDYDDLSLTDFERALNRTIRRHDMLRAVLVGDDAQRILADVPDYAIEAHDLSGASDDARTRELDRLRDAFVTLRFEPGAWPSFRIAAARLERQRYRLFFAFDMMFVDLFSARVLMRELESIYRRDDIRLPSIDISFRDYATAALAAGQGVEFERAKAYWLARGERLAKPPQLPVARHRPDDDARYRFKRRGFRLPRAHWQSLSTRAQRQGVSPTSVLLAAYAATLGTWSGDDEFSVVVTLFNRLPLHPDVEKLVGDFTSSLIFGCERPGDETAAETFGRVQARLRDDLDHRAFGGVELLREMTRRNGGGRILMPVVFTSALGLPASGPRQPSLLSGRLVDSVTQTSHVWIDNQIEEADGELAINWDAVDAQFPPGLVDAMFAHYRRVLTTFATRDDAWTTTLDAAGDAGAQRAIDVPADAAAPATLHGEVLKTVGRCPDRIAIVTADRKLTYATLAGHAHRVASALAGLGVQPGERVGLLLDKGWEAPVAMLAVSLSGGAYVPIDPGWPEARRSAVVSAARLAVVVTQPHLAVLAPAGCLTLVIDDTLLARASAAQPRAAQPDDVAYVMFTSGTTGEPKGVVIEHRAVATTIASINRLFDVTDADRVLCVSSLCFDLSVYDIWGPLFCGATCVMMSSGDGARPWRWLEFVETHRVTIWNSVPALMELLLDACTNRGTALSSLRVALLSGDWIPLSMPDRIRRAAPGVDVVSLGGATEASIWSIYFPIGTLDPDWVSVPYGRALPHQQVNVLDRRLQRCPVWAAGEIYIGGAGLARGYWDAPEKTAAQFVRHPETGARLYRTGDIGCYMPNGDIRFMGRRDGQVKLNGLRVELGEIESVLLAHPLVKNAVANVGHARQLSAHVVLASPDASDARRLLLRHAEAHLPGYMVPTAIDIVAALPIGANGKVDRAALRDAVTPAAGPERDRGSSDVIVEPVVAELWQVMLQVAQPKKQDHFFASGGDSLIATRFVAKLNAIFGLDLTARAIYDHPTLQTLAEHVEASRDARIEAAEPMPLAFADDSATRFAPFALTDIQRSYHVGRRDDMTLGAVAAHSYIEIDYRGLDLARFEEAVNRLVERHGMLRCIFPNDGEQRVLDRVPRYTIQVDDVGGESAARQCDRLEATRSRLSAKAYDPAAWPLFSIAATRHGDGLTRVHISLDIIIADAWSTNVIARDLLAFYHGTQTLLPALRFAFRDYVTYMEAFRHSARYRRMRDYWQRRLDTLPPPPALPVRPARDGTSSATFTRYTKILDEACWTRLKTRSLGCGATPSAMLLTVFGRVLRLASRTSSFVINVTHFNRPPIHPDINDIVGDFASTFLLEYECRDGEPLDTAIGALCRQILSDLDHSQYSGVRVLQDISRRRGRVALAPVVFTSALVLPVNSGVSVSSSDVHGEVVHALTQTPQVWLDHQVYQEEGRLLLAWDVRDDMFDADLIRSMFGLYVAVLERLSDDADAWRAPGLDAPPARVAECRAHLARLAGEQGIPGDDGCTDADVDILIAKLVAHPAVAEARAADVNAAGGLAIRVRLSEDAVAHLSRDTDDAHETLLSPLDRLETKRGWMVGSAGSSEGWALPEPAGAQRLAHLARRSYRHFWGAPVGTETLAQLLDAASGMPGPASARRKADAGDMLAWIGCLAALHVASLPLPKFAYPSAGSCYGVYAYLGVPARCALPALPPGWYALDPVARRLMRCGDAGPAWPAQGDAPLVLLAADLERIASLYGERAQAFAELEAGAMSAVLDAAARQRGLAVRSRTLDARAVVTGVTPIAAFELGDDRVAQEPSGEWRHVVRARVHRRDGARLRIATYVPGMPMDDEDAHGGCDAFDGFKHGDRHLLFELSVESDANAHRLDGQRGKRLAIGAFCQRLMAAAPDRDIGLCMLGFTPKAFARDMEADTRCYLVGGPLEPRQQRIAQGDTRAERDLASVLLREHAHGELERAQASLAIEGGVRTEFDGPDEGGALGDSPADAPVDLIDAAVRDIWRDVLQVPYVSGRANFFRLGGTSIDALAILRRLHDRYFIELRLRDVLAEPTVHAMARLLRENTRWSETIREVHALLEVSADAGAAFDSTSR